jgi:predicted TIM-barrel fold metal-dependent hydrolase
MDWPPSRYFDTPPEPEDWVRLLLNYAPEAAERQAILVDNPAALYGFPPVTAAARV